MCVKRLGCNAIYAHPTLTIRSNLWVYLKHLRSLVSKPWMLLGDFNEVLLPSESHGGVFVSSKAMAFAESVDECLLIDLGACGGRFTWFRTNKGTRKVAK